MKVSYSAVALLALLTALSSCTKTALPTAPGGAAASAAIAVEADTQAPTAEAGAAVPEDASIREEGESVLSATHYIRELAEKTVAEITQPGMGDFDKAKALFDYMIESATLVDPVGLDLWRIRAYDGVPPPYLENRSLSVLLYHVGKCEDYAAAYTLLLQAAGLEAEYVPGLTYSSQGALVDHAWTIAKIDGVWYHLDCQLEQNISRHGSVRYKYFMRGDATMAGSHRWGQNLIDSRLLTAEQNAEIAESFRMQPCPQDYPTPPRQSVEIADPPDLAVIRAAIDAEWREYETINGPLEALEINKIPPVFALEGYGPHD